MSYYSSSTSDYTCDYCPPGGSGGSGSIIYPPSMNNPQMMSQVDKEQLLHTLRTHKVNTLTELRRIEKVFASIDVREYSQPMTAAWNHYVSSNSLLSELRGLTRNYPFSNECLDDAKWRVIEDPDSALSWNYCWLVLNKIRKDNLIPKHAHATSIRPQMWGGRVPDAHSVAQLTAVLTQEWTRAVDQMLRHWAVPPVMTM
ncbi:hypothetical protein DFH27DRAFT_159911 [Peziza echinospora]|nr:hypothetical protein DFH27DRAFT_159911 [Peziza echinospora]